MKKIIETIPVSSTNIASLEKLRKLAERFCSHKFDILGSGWQRVAYGEVYKGFEGKNYSKKIMNKERILEIPQFYKYTHLELLKKAKELVSDYEPIDWQVDFKSGARYKINVHYKSLTYGNIPGMDAKVSADLGRLYHFTTLAKAYKVFKEKKYLMEIIAQLLDFIGSNPFEYGAAWRNTMNVAIRAANIVIALEIIGIENISSEIKKLILSYLIKHGIYIMNNLEWPKDSFHPNHFIANLAGLLMLATFTDNPEWKSFAIHQISEQLVYQVHPEGSHFEHAFSYHCFVLEMLTCALLYTAKKEQRSSLEEIKKWLKTNLKKESYKRYINMFYFYREILQPDGLIPLIGDNDSGRFIYLETPILDSRDYRFLLVIGGELFDKNLYVSHNKVHEEYATLLLGKKIKKPSSYYFSIGTHWREAGFYIMRDPNTNSYISISCGPIGTNSKGGHAHNDKLSFTLQVGGLDILVDPGTYVYTASKYFRNLYRSVKMHNTIYIEGIEQNRFGDDNPWWGMKEETNCKCVLWENTREEGMFIGIHYGYKEKIGIVHKRHVRWEKITKKITIKDELIGNIPENTKITANFILHPKCITVSYTPTKVEIMRKNIIVSFETLDGKWDYEPAWYSPKYGKKFYTQKLIAELPSKKEFLFTIKIF